jgi:hypothetical protein
MCRDRTPLYDARVDRRTRWYWLLLVPIVVPLLTFLYNSLEPRLFGFPLFYWLQLSFVLLGSVCCWIVYVRTKS